LIISPTKRSNSTSPTKKQHTNKHKGQNGNTKGHCDFIGPPKANEQCCLHPYSNHTYGMCSLNPNSPNYKKKEKFLNKKKSISKDNHMIVNERTLVADNATEPDGESPSFITTTNTITP
jgi:hypothetical protein